MCSVRSLPGMMIFVFRPKWSRDPNETVSRNPGAVQFSSRAASARARLSLSAGTRNVSLNSGSRRSLRFGPLGSFCLYARISAVRIIGLCRWAERMCGRPRVRACRPWTWLRARSLLFRGRGASRWGSPRLAPRRGSPPRGVPRLSRCVERPGEVRVHVVQDVPLFWRAALP